MSERITEPRSEAQYRQRSGPPLPGCDCMQCFGYCIVNGDIRDREIRAGARPRRGQTNDGSDPRSLNFED